MKNYKPLFEKQTDIKVGDEVLLGKFKNKRAKVTGFAVDDKGQPILKTTKGNILLYKARIAKLIPDEKKKKKKKKK